MPITFITKKSGGGGGVSKYMVPAGTVIMMQTASTLSGFSRYSAIDNYYIVASPLSTAIGTQGGSNTHSHSTSIASIGGASVLHKHTLSGNSGRPSQNENYFNYGTSVTLSSTSHTHNVPANTQTGDEPAHTHTLASGTSGTATFEPAYKTLVGYIANTDSPLPNNAIIMWSGGTPPAKFKLCDGTHSPVDMRGFFLKLSNSYGSGGSNASHTHPMGGLATGGSHNHSASFNLTGASMSGIFGDTRAKQNCAPAHGHEVEYTTEVAAGGHTHANKNSVANTANPPSLSLYFIQYQE